MEWLPQKMTFQGKFFIACNNIDVRMNLRSVATYHKAKLRYLNKEHTLIPI